MAKPPKINRWNIEVPEDAGWFGRALNDLQNFIANVTFALSGRLNRQDNFSSMLKVVDIDTTNDNFPLVFDCTLPTQPECIQVAQAVPITRGGVFTGPVTAAYWESFTGSGSSGIQIRLHDITGLAANTRYAITLIIT